MKLEINNLIKKYNSKTVLNNLSLSIEDFQVLALIGPSGCGKSTLLRLIAGLEGYDEGTVKINNALVTQSDAADYRKKIGFVFQDHNLFDHISAFENICLVLEKVHKRKRNEFEPFVNNLLKSFDLIEHKDKLPHQLSGGQSQRVSIVRALSIDPELIILDEPTSSLDPVLTYEVLTAIQKLRYEQKDFIIVTHEIGFAKKVADYIVFMDEGDIIEHGYNDILANPKTEKLSNFLDKVLSFSHV